MPEEIKASVKPVFDKKDIDENKALAAVGYIGILCLIPLLTKKDSKFAQECGKQGFVLFILEIAVWIVGMVPILGWFIVWPLGSLLTIILSVICLVKALQGEFWEVPVIGQYRKSVNF